jgi:MFS family permease
VATHGATAAAPPAATATVASGFLGWRILAWCTLVMGLSAPGQTIGVSVFIDRFVADLGLTRAEVSGAYLVGTVLGALSLPAIGGLVDRRGARLAMAAIGFGFGAALIGMGAVQGLVTLAIAFVGIRALGQGGLMLVGQTNITLWFERRRGFAMALSLTISSGIMSLAPIAFALMIDGVGWRGAWVLIGIGVWLTVVPIALVWIIDRPSAVGQVPDGSVTPLVAPALRQPPRQRTVAEALRSPAFWSVNLISMLTAAFATGATFHHFAILAARDIGEAQAAAVFLPQVVGMVAAGFSFGWAADRIPARALLPASAGVLALGLGLATVVTPGALAIAYGIMLGAAQGAIRSTAAVVLPRWFGVANIGAIRGIETAMMVGASALGPLVFALGNDAAGGYGPVLAVTAVLALFAGALAAAVRPPDSAVGCAEAG